MRDVIQEVHLSQRKAIGFQGGNTRRLIDLSIRQIAMRIGSDAGVAAGRIDAEESVNVTRYLSVLVVVAGFVSTGLAYLAYRWAASLPVRRDGLNASAKPWWACVVAVLIFAALFLLGLATAPTGVLRSRMLLPLRSASGVTTLAAQRVIIALLALAPIGLLYLCYVCL